MTLATAMLFPTNFLQNHYLDLVEIERESEISEEISIEHTPHAYLEETSPEHVIPSFRPREESFQLAIRIISLTNTALQFICATFETLPILAVTTVTVLLNATNSGFVSQDGGRLERIGLASLAALSSVWAPVGTSLWAVFDPSKLSEYKSFVQLLPSIAQAELLSFTLPSLPRLADSLGPEARSELEKILGRRCITAGEDGASAEEELESTRSRKSDSKSESETGPRGKVDLLERADIVFWEWRTKLRDELARRAEYHHRLLYNGIDISSEDFYLDLQHGARMAAGWSCF